MNLSRALFILLIDLLRSNGSPRDRGCILSVDKERNVLTGCSRIYIVPARKNPDEFVLDALRYLESVPVRELQKMEGLDIRGSPVTQEAATTLSNLLQSNHVPELTDVTLVKCNMGDEEAAILAVGFKNRRLLNINLSYNRIGDKGAIALADALESNHDLEEFQIDHNFNISTPGATSLVNALGFKVSFGGGFYPMTPHEANYFAVMFDNSVNDISCNFFQGIQNVFKKISTEEVFFFNQMTSVCNEVRTRTTIAELAVNQRDFADAFVVFLQLNAAGRLALASARVAEVFAKNLTGHFSASRVPRVQMSVPRRHRLERNATKAPREALSLQDTCFSFVAHSHDLMWTNMFFYPKLTEGSTGPCLDAASDQLKAELFRLAAPPCSHLVQEHSPIAGFGSMVSSWVKPFMFAIEHNRTFLSPSLGAYRESDSAKTKNSYLSRTFHCTDTSLVCFMEPLSTCEVLHRNRTHRSKVGAIKTVVPSTHELFDKYSLFEQKRDASNPVVVPERYRHKGYFWWASNLLSFLLATPNHDLQLHLESSKKAAGWSRMKRPMLSMHVRHGDTCTLAEEDYTKRRCEPLSVYLEDAVLPMSRRYGIKTIFLATDDDQVIEDTKKFPQFEWLFVPGLERGDLKKRYWDKNIRDGSLDNFGEALAALTDLFLLAEGDTYVGKFTSNMDRIAYSLLTTRKRGLVPFASLDSTWCMDWGTPSGMSVHGRFQC